MTMTKVTKKTKKAFLILAAVERGLFVSNVEASRKTNEELYNLIIDWDSKNLPTEQPKEQKEKPVVDAKPEKVDAEKQPKKETKKKLPTKKEQKKEVAPETVRYDDPKPFRLILLQSISEKYGVDYSTVKGSGISKKYYTEAIKRLNDSVEYAMNALSTAEQCDVKVSVIDANGQVSDYDIPMDRNMVSTKVKEISEEKNIPISKTKEEPKSVLTEQPKEQKEKPVVDAKPEPIVGSQSKEEKEMVEEIVEAFSVLKKELEIVRKENDSLKKANAKLKSNAENARVSLIEFMNKLANTKSEQYVWVWRELKKYLNTNLSLYKSADSVIILDIEKLIIEESVRLHEEAKLKGEIEQKKKEVVKDDSANYEGTNISYINGDVAKPDGVTKRKYNRYVEWYDDCVSWVDYVLEQLAEAENQSKAQSKKTLKALKADLDDWYLEWQEPCGDIIADMAINIMDELIDAEQADRDKALSDFVALIDDLDL